MLAALGVEALRPVAKHPRPFIAEVREVAAEALERLRGYPWPGNMREQQSVLKQAILRSHGGGLRYEPQPAGACFAVELWPVENIAES